MPLDSWENGCNNTPPSHPILAGPPQLTPPNSDCLQLFLHTPSPRLPCPSHFPLSLRVPAKCLSRICCRLPKSMTNPSPLPSLYFCNNLLLSRPFTSTFLTHLFMNFFSLFVFVFVTRHVSKPYNRTDFTFVPKILILFCREREVALQMGRRVLKAYIALFILFLIP